VAVRQITHDGIRWRLTRGTDGRQRLWRTDDLVSPVWREIDLDSVADDDSLVAQTAYVLNELVR
jgi:hypothetical protein